jgi:hypothetical protein
VRQHALVLSCCVGSLCVDDDTQACSPLPRPQNISDQPGSRGSLPRAPPPSQPSTSYTTSSGERVVLAERRRGGGIDGEDGEARERVPLCGRGLGNIKVFYGREEVEEEGKAESDKKTFNPPSWWRGTRTECTAGSSDFCESESLQQLHQQRNHWAQLAGVKSVQLGAQV